MVVSWQSLFLVHFLADFALLTGVNRMHGRRACWLRSCCGALLSAGYGSLCLYPAFAPVSGIFCRVLWMVLVAAVALGISGNFWRRWISYGLFSFALTGAAAQLGENDLPGLLLAAALLWLLGRLCPGEAARQYYPLVLHYGGHCCHLTALADTGNCLRDPVTGQAVLVAGEQAAQELLGLTPGQLARPVEAMEAAPLPGMRLIPYHTVGCPAGFLLAVSMDVEWNGKKHRCPVAFAPGRIGTHYQALIGGNL